MDIPVNISPHIETSENKRGLFEGSRFIASTDSSHQPKIYVYPIKSLRPTQLTKATATRHGFAYDRKFMILQALEDGTYKNMHVSDYPEMTQFLTDIVFPEDNNGRGSLLVEFVAPSRGQSTTLEIPLVPDTNKLETFDVNMHRSPTKAFKMPAEYNSWFSSCFGYNVILVYLGDNRRHVLFEEMIPKKSDSWLSTISQNLPSFGPIGLQDEQITFADCAPYLIVSKTSLAQVSSRLPDGEEMDVTKFRPNIVVEGAEKPWEEDFWAKIRINDADIITQHNCVRCKSLNIDYKTGLPGLGPSGEVLKKLQKDRRVDKGSKWSPVFGRYSFWNPRNGEKILSVGDKVTIQKLNHERTTWSKTSIENLCLIKLLTRHRLGTLIPSTLRGLLSLPNIEC